MASSRSSVLVLLLVLLLLPATGCAYFRNVGKDATEMIHVGVGASLVPGLYAYAQAPIFATSVGYLPKSVYVGSDYGYTHMWKQAGAGILLGGQLVRTPMDADIETYWTGYLADAYLDQSHYLILNVVASDKRTAFSRGHLGLTKFDIGLHVLFVGAQAGVDFVEVLDFATGLFGWDLLDDNDFGRAPEDDSADDEFDAGESAPADDAIETDDPPAADAEPDPTV